MSEQKCDRCQCMISDRDPLPPLSRKAFQVEGEIPNFRVVCSRCFQRWKVVKPAIFVWLHEQDFGSYEQEWAVDSRDALKLESELASRDQCIRTQNLLAKEEAKILQRWKDVAISSEQVAKKLCDIAEQALSWLDAAGILETQRKALRAQLEAVKGVKP